MKSATRRPFPGRKARPSPGAPQAVGDGGEAMRVRTAGISRAEVNSHPGATKVEWLAGPDAIARCHAHPRNSDARRTPAHRPTPVPIALTRTAVMMPTWAPIHHPSALPTVAATSPMSRVTCYLLEKSGRTLVRSRTLFSRLAVVTIRLPKGECVGTRAVGLEVREVFHRLRN